MNSLNFSISLSPISINKAGQHWGWRTYQQEKWGGYLLEVKAKSHDFSFEPTVKRRVKVTFNWGKRGVLPDNDNLIAGFKPIRDMLTRLGFIKDDSPKWSDFSYFLQRRSYTNTEFEIEDL